MEIPLFPLSSLILPEGLMQLRIFEPRYLDMIKRCFRDNTDFAVCLIRDGHEVGQPAEPHPIGTRVRISDWSSGTDGLLTIMITGYQCIRLISFEANKDNLLIGQVEAVPIECPVVLDEDFRPLADKLDYMLGQLSGFVDLGEKKLDDAVWVSNRLIELLPMPGQDKMILLQMQCANDRLRILQQIGFQ